MGPVPLNALARLYIGAAFVVFTLIGLNTSSRIDFMLGVVAVTILYGMVAYVEERMR